MGLAPNSCSRDNCPGYFHEILFNIIRQVCQKCKKTSSKEKVHFKVASETVTIDNAQQVGDITEE